MDEFKKLRATNKLKGKRFTEVIEEYVADAQELNSDLLSKLSLIHVRQILSEQCLPEVLSLEQKQYHYIMNHYHMIKVRGRANKGFQKWLT